MCRVAINEMIIMTAIRIHIVTITLETSSPNMVKRASPPWTEASSLDTAKAAVSDIVFTPSFQTNILNENAGCLAISAAQKPIDLAQHCYIQLHQKGAVLSLSVTPGNFL